MGVPHDLSSSDSLVSIGEGKWRNWQCFPGREEKLSTEARESSLWSWVRNWIGVVWGHLCHVLPKAVQALPCYMFIPLLGGPPWFISRDGLILVFEDHIVIMLYEWFTGGHCVLVPMLLISSLQAEIHYVKAYWDLTQSFTHLIIFKNSPYKIFGHL